MIFSQYQSLYRQPSQLTYTYYRVFKSFPIAVHCLAILTTVAELLTRGQLLLRWLSDELFLIVIVSHSRKLRYAVELRNPIFFTDRFHFAFPLFLTFQLVHCSCKLAFCAWCGIQTEYFKYNIQYITNDNQAAVVSGLSSGITVWYTR